MRFFCPNSLQSRIVALAFAAVFADAPGAFAGAAPPARIVSLSPAITETVYAIGLGSHLVGVSTYCDWPPEARALPKVGTFSEPVAEAIVALAPDVVLTSPSPGNEAAVRAIERAGVRVEVVQSEGGLAEVRGAMLEVARAVGAADAGERLVATIDARLDAVRAKAAALPHPRVAVVVGREPLVLAGPASYLGELVDLAGGTNVAAAAGGRWPRVGVELLVTSAPEVIVDLSAAMDASGPEQAAPAADRPAQPREGQPSEKEKPADAWKTLASVPAVTSGRIVAERTPMMLRPGPRIAESAEAMFAALHPEAAAAAATAAPPAGHQ